MEDISGIAEAEQVQGVEDMYPLSPMQKGMLFHTLYSPDSGVYCDQQTTVIRGGLNVSAFEQAWQQALDRHPALRSVIDWEDLDEPLQVVLRGVKAPLIQYDWREFPAPEQKKRLSEFLNADQQSGFDLSQPPLMRLILIRISDDSYYFVWSSHHIILDGWSTALLLQEVFALYDAACQGRRPALRRSRPFRDYIAWLLQQDLSQAEAFWREILAGYTSAIPLGLIRPLGVPAQQSFLEVETRLSEKTAQELQAFARQQQVTLNTLAQAAWALLLSRYSGRPDVVFGVTVSGRPPDLPGVESIIGLFINTLPLRVEMTPDDSLGAWLKGLQQLQAQMSQFEYSPLVEVQKWSDVPGGRPLFETILVFENYPVDQSMQDSGQSQGLGIRNVKNVEKTNYPLDVTALPGREFVLRIAWDGSRFDTTSVQRMLLHLARMMQSLLGDPQRRLSDLPLLSPSEKRQLLLEWNDIQTDWPQDAAIHRFFEQQAQRTPQATAVKHLGRSLTFGELNSRANQLARRLRELGAGPDAVVGLCAQRSPEMVLGLLGVLKSGAAYLPLDPAYPPKRLAFMLQDAKASILVAHRCLQAALPDQPERRFYLDADWDQAAGCDDGNLTVDADPANLAYVVYTSGSTGVPKGVMVTHSCLVNAVMAWRATYRIQGTCRSYLQMANLSFDVFSGDLLRGMWEGAQLVLCPEDWLLEPDKMFQLIRDEKVDCAEFVPAVLRNLVEHVKSAGQKLDTMRVVAVGSDTWYMKELREFQRCCSPRTRLINSFGMTEATIDTTFFEGDDPRLADDRMVPIGRPFPNSRVYILDANLDPAPMGVAGELCIGGPGPGRGYFGRPALTAERFIPDPFGVQTGSRLYRTGDMAGYQPEGRIEFLGRQDQQLKIRGFRIEAAEVESALAGHPSVSESAVLVREDQPGLHRLVAYLTTRNGDSVFSAPDLQDYLRQRLPDYMVPVSYVTLESMPLTHNRKVDRKALAQLPPPESSRGDQEPTTPTEELLASIWCDVLGLEKAGPGDNFFDQGGHSLLATQIVSRIRRAFQVELPLRSIFESPGLASLARRIEEARLAEGEQAAPALVRADRQGELPLSFAQQRLWFLDQLQPGSTLYNLPTAVRLRGEVDPAVLAAGIREIVARHESLRTCFPVRDGNPVQLIRQQASLPLTVVDLRGCSQQGREAELSRIATQEADRPFDLASGPLLRVLLVRLEGEEMALLATMHHIVSDGWSMDVFVRELVALYQALSAGRPSPLPPLPLQYADFAVWQRSWLRGEVLRQHLNYWKDKLGGISPLDLSADRPRPAAPTHRGGIESFELPEELSDTLKELSRSQDSTLFMTLLAAFQTLLYRYSGQEDIAVGTPIANRNRAETEAMIGFFVNTLVLRTDFSAEPTFRELLGRARETALEAFAHQDIPYERVVEALQPERSLGGGQLFQVMFSLQNTSEPAEAPDLGGIEVAPVASEATTSKFDLTMAMGRGPKKVVGAVEYSSDRFDLSSVQRIMKHFRTLLESLAADPDQSVSRLSLISREERRFLLEGFNATRTEYPRQATIAQLFENQVRQRPDTVAATFGGRQLSYAELNRRADQLARRLQGLGLSPDRLAGLLTPRSLEMLVGMLGILKAGGAYLPLEADFPLERLALMLSDSQARLVLTMQDLRARLPEGTQTISLDLDWGEPQGSEVLPARTHPQNLAYVIYTSGSTGMPKGVAVQQQAVVRLVMETDYVQLGSRDCVAQAANHAFDAATFEVWGALLQGGRLAGVHRETLLSPHDFECLLRSHQVNTLFLTTALFNQIAASAPRAFAGLKHLLFGGELVDPRWVRRVLQDGPPQRLLHVYGPTESTTYACWHLVQEVAPGATNVPIGQPLANTTLLVLDRHLNPSPTGVPAELHIGGEGLARGYLKRPSLTAQRFVPHPFADGERLYRTGDVVRLREESGIEFMGRVDDQVKIRGFRIEPGEIEAVLAEHPAVRQCAVLARGGAGAKRLVAYVVSSRPAGELRSFLKGRLPAYMVPSSFVPLESLPLNPNGKVDRRALPEAAPTQTLEEYVAPLTPTEEMLASIWADVLGVERVGRFDSLFELGGHSLMATQLVSRIRTVMQVDLALRALFEAPQLAELAQAVDSARFSEEGIVIPPLSPAPRQAEYPLSFAQQRLWFLDQLTPGSPLYNIPAAVRLKGRLNVAALEMALNEVLRRHEALRTSFVSVGGKPVQIIQDEVHLPLTLIDLSACPPGTREAQLRRLTREAAQRAFDLTSGRLLRVRLFRLRSEEHGMLINMHHIASDGWSMNVLLQEMTALYAAFSRARPSPLAPLPVQYVDFALWQRQWLSGEILEQQLDYWRERLKDAQVLELPADRPRPAASTYRGSWESFVLPVDLTDSLLELSRSHNATLYMTLLAAFQTLLYRYSGQSDVSVGTPIANRNRSEIEDLIGFFVNTLVMRADFSQGPRFLDLLAQVREAALQAYAHQDVPFDQVVDAVQPDRSQAGSLLFQVMFTLQSASASPSSESGDLEVVPMLSEAHLSKFDLTLEMAQAQGFLAGEMEYSLDLFEPATIRRMLKHFQTLLESILATPNQPVWQLMLISSAQRRFLLEEFNATRSGYPRQATLAHLFDIQAQKRPDSPAAVFAGRHLSYGELSSRADRIARLLQGMHLAPDESVGLFTERSLEMVMAMVGTLKAGGAYLPLDPDYPPQRLSLMLSDASTRLVLTQGHLSRRLPQGEVKSFCLDRDWHSIAQVRKQGPLRAGHPQNLAYVIYTSGSTGVPKGVAVPQQAVVRLVIKADYVQIESADRVAQAASSAFDAATFEIWGPLLNGACLAGVPRETALSPAHLADHIQKEQINTLFLTTALFNQIARQAPWAFAGLRHLLFGGELVDPRWVRQVLQEGPPQRLLHVYGPTESTTYASWHLVEDVAAEALNVPIGHPLANTTLYVLDPHLNPSPEGVPGHLFIGGDGLARGYLRRPSLTAERFVPHPFADGQRLYQTGDVVRLRKDEGIEFLGRVDDQVKIRGFRIEPGEVEAALASHPDVEQCAVQARGEADAKRLIAYLVSAAAPDELRSFLKGRLPSYMVPSSFVMLESLPLTPNGKVDRKALPDEAPVESLTAYSAPATPTEELLAGIWAEVLGQERVGRNGNFFELGGHSLLATQVVSRIRQAFAVELPLRELFEAPELPQLAQRVDQARRSQKGIALPAMRRAPRGQDLPLSFAQQRLWFLDQLEPGSFHYNIPLALRLSGSLDIPAFQASLEEIVRRHEGLRTVFPVVDDSPYQVIIDEMRIGLPIIDLTSCGAGQQGELRRLAVEEAQQPFDLGEGPLVRTRLVRLDDEEHALLATLHHIVSDGWSIGILIQELTALYEAFTSRRPSPLPDLPVQYADFASWQRQWLSGDVLEEQIEYWRRKLAGAQPTKLPADRPQPSQAAFRGDSVYFHLNEEQSRALRELSRAQDATLYMTLLAAFQTLLQRYSQQQEVCVATVVANRTRAETERMIGFFINTLLLRTDFSGQPSFVELLHSVRQTALEAYEHQDVPFEQLVEAVPLQRSSGRVSLAQAVFQLQNVPTRSLQLSGLSLRTLEHGVETAKRDLTLTMVEEGEAISGSWTFNTDLFESSTISRMAQNFQILISDIVARPDAPVDELEIRTEAEKERQVKEKKKRHSFEFEKLMKIKNRRGSLEKRG